MYIAIGNSITSSSQMNGAAASGGGGGFESTYSMEFDGIDGYITCGNFNSLAGVNTFSVSFWAKFNTVALNDTLLNHYSTLGFRADAQNNKMTFRWSSSDSTTVLVQSTNTITTGTWKHYACTYDNTDFKLYENGSLISTTNEPSKTYRSILNQNLLMGKYWFGLQRLFDGLMDELSIFNYALTPSEITSIYNSGSPNNLDDLTTSPSLWFRMGEEATWDGSKWTLTGQGSDTYTAESSNMVEADKKTDVPS